MPNVPEKKNRKITPSTYLIGPFLTSHNCSIPDLQRPYAWTLEQALELNRDLKRVIGGITAEDVPQHFFGTIVLISGNTLSIIDGQQRLTTVSLLLGILEKAIRELSELAKIEGGPHSAGVIQSADQIANDIHNLLWSQGPLDTDGKLRVFPQLIVSPEIHETFGSFISCGDGEINAERLKPADNLRRIAEYFGEKLIKDPEHYIGDPLNKLLYLRRIYEAITKGLLIVTLQTDSPDAGYDLFESLNAKGLPLNTLDLIKVWMLSTLSDEDCRGLALQMRKLANDDIQKQLNFFKAFYRARAMQNTKDAEGKHLALLAREHIFKDTNFGVDPDGLTISQRIRSEVDLMASWTPVWQLLNQNKISPSFNGTAVKRAWCEHRLELLVGDLNHKGVIFPLLMVASDKLKNDLDKFTELVHILERFFFRYKIMCGGTVSNIESAYYSFIKILDATNDIDLNFVKEKLQTLLDEFATEARFKQRLIEKLNYSSANRRIQIKYFFWTLDNYSYPNPPRVVSQDIHDWHLEHISPQNPQVPGPLGSDVDRLGNLCLLNPAINILLSNLEFGDKKTKADLLRKEGKNIDLVDSQNIFYKYKSNTWTVTDLIRREDDLISQALKIFSFGSFSPLQGENRIFKAH